jgi:hypothetical protein
MTNTIGGLPSDTNRADVATAWLNPSERYSLTRALRDALSRYPGSRTCPTSGPP